MLTCKLSCLLTGQPVMPSRLLSSSVHPSAPLLHVFNTSCIQFQIQSCKNHNFGSVLIKVSEVKNKNKNTNSGLTVSGAQDSHETPYELGTVRHFRYTVKVCCPLVAKPGTCEEKMSAFKRFNLRSLFSTPEVQLYTHKTARNNWF